jgi:enoyl-CoA hydratase
METPTVSTALPTPPPQWSALVLEVRNAVAHLALNRPEKANAMNATLWQELRAAFVWADETPEIRAVVLYANGKLFSAGIDLELLMSVSAMTQASKYANCAGRVREDVRRLIVQLQEAISSIERCRKPVIAAVHGACVGGAVDLICACDMRFCSADAACSIKEIDMGMVADLGTLQRLPRLIPEGLVRELAYTGRSLSAAEAERCGFVNRVLPDRTALLAHVTELAEQIAAKSPLAVRGTKEMLLYARDHSVEDGLNYVATWNAAMLISNDLSEAFAAQMAKRPASFAD